MTTIAAASTDDNDLPATINMADDEDAQPEVLLPCAVCGRKFNPRSLEKHVRICERTAARKRKPFDSAKQRIQGTELAEFLPKHHNQQQESSAGSNRRSGGHAEERITCGKKPNNAWKQTRDEFLRAIRAARGDNVSAPSQQQQHHHNQSHVTPSTSNHTTTTTSHQSPQQRPSTLSLVTASGPPTRANEKGQCPTCQRQFGVKSYDRHVAFCRERATRLPASPQTSNNVAKERLEARMKYRAPTLKNRKPTNREKYSPGAHNKVQSPMLARSPMKNVGVDKERREVKSIETASPKLPMLKRPGQTNKESPVTNNGPLKSRPIDRSNRLSSDSQDSLNPPAIKQLFSSRRLLLLSGLLPSKILQSKNSITSPSPLKPTARLVSHFLQKEIVDVPLLTEQPEIHERKTKKRIKLKIRGHRKVKAKEEVIEKVEEVEAAEAKKDFVTWQQIREDINSNKEVKSIDKESMPAMSDITGLSSFDEGNSTTDEFEYNERMVSKYETKKYEKSENKSQILGTQIEEPIFADNSPLNSATLNKTYVIRNKAKVESLILENQDSFNTLKSSEKPNADESDDEEGLSSASTKTFCKNDRRDINVDFVDSLDQCHVQESNDKISRVNENRATTSSTEDSTKTSVDCDIRTNDGKPVDENKLSEASNLSKKMKERLRPQRSFSMPNIVKTNDVVSGICVNLGDKNNDRSLMGDPEETIDSREGSPTPRNSPTQSPNHLAYSNRRCATYVMKEASPPTHNDPSQPDAREDSSTPRNSPNPSRCCATYVIDETEATQCNPSPLARPVSSKDKPLKKRRKLQQQQSKNELTHENKEERFVLYDYYRNEGASFSDASSVKTDDLPGFDDNFEDENESNVSEMDMCLAKESKVKMVAGYGSEDSVEQMLSRMKKVELVEERPRTDGKARRCKNTRTNDTYIERNEETSISRIELTDLATHHSEKPIRHFEKEICTITRLDVIDHENTFLPNIIRDQHSRTKYRREKFAKTKPQLLRGIIELETPREDEEMSERGNHKSRSSQTPSFPRRSMHSDRRSLLRRSFERLPRCDWNSYIRRHPDFSMILRGRIGADKDYNPFLLAEQQLNDLFSDTSDQSSTDGSAICPPQKPNSSPNFPLSHSSAFVKYPLTSSQQNSPSQSQSQQQQNGSTDKSQPQRISLIAPPTGFDDLTSSDLSSDCTETNSLSRELLSSSSNSTTRDREHVFGRKVIIDQNQALGGGEFAPSNSDLHQSKMTNGMNSRVARPIANRSNSMRSASAPKPPERKISSSSSSGSSDFARTKSNNPKQLNKSHSIANDTQQRGTNYKNTLNGSNLSLSSIISSTDLEMKRSNSLFDELLSSFEDDANSTSTLPSLISLMRNDPSMSLLSSSTTTTTQQNGVNGHHSRGMANGRICSDDDGELSSPESVKRQERGGKLSADSAYSSLNRKYSSSNNNTTGQRSANDVSAAKLKMSKFCHECGFKFPDSAKFCCECGVKRLTL